MKKKRGKKGRKRNHNKIRLLSSLSVLYVFFSNQTYSIHTDEEEKKEKKIPRENLRFHYFRYRCIYVINDRKKKEGNL